MRCTERITASSAVNSMVCADRFTTGPAGGGVRPTDTPVTGGTRGEVTGAKLICTDGTVGDRFYTVVSTAPIAGDSIVVTPRISAGVTGHSIIGAEFYFTGSTRSEMSLTDRVRTRIAGVYMGGTVQLAISAAPTEL